MEPWNLKTDDTRSADSLTTFIIFCEGDVTEPLYFSYFETPTIKINTVPGIDSKMHHVQKAMEHCFINKVFVYQDGLPFLNDTNIHLWCVFDRDIDTTNDARILTGNIAFDNSLHTAEKNGLNVAWSNDAFELWILLHFEDVDATDVITTTRDYYYQRLTDILKGVQNPSEGLQKVLQRPNFNYKSHFKRRDDFINVIRKMMLPNTKQAIQRAEKLLEQHKNPIKPAHQMTPCTLVFKLVNELINRGGKVLPIQEQVNDNL